MSDDEIVQRVNAKLDLMPEGARSAIQAIKCIREATAWGLGDAKQWYDNHKPRLHIGSEAAQRAYDPRPLTPPPSPVEQARARLDTLVSLNTHSGVHFAVVDRRGRWRKVNIAKLECFAAGQRLPKPPRKKRKAKRVHKCYQCSTTEDVSLRENPYAAEIHHDYTRHWMCGNCAHQSAQDI